MLTALFVQQKAQVAMRWENMGMETSPLKRKGSSPSFRKRSTKLTTFEMPTLPYLGKKGEGIYLEISGSGD